MVIGTIHTLILPRRLINYIVVGIINYYLVALYHSSMRNIGMD